MARTEYINMNTGEPAFDLRGWPRNGQKVRFLNKNGYEYQLEKAKEAFNVDDEYTIKDCVVGMSSSYYKFEEVTGDWNTVMFEVIANEG